VDDYVDLSNNDLFNFGTGDFTVQAWINPVNNNQNSRIVAKGHTGAEGTYQLAINTNGTLRLAFHNSGNESDPNIIQPNVWQHLILAREANSVRGYVNGIKVLEYTTNPLDLTSNQNLVLGYEPGYSSWFNGLIDEVAIWSTALSQAEIQANMFNELTGNEEGLVGYSLLLH
jgi:hypothetical protein